MRSIALWAFAVLTMLGAAGRAEAVINVLDHNTFRQLITITNTTGNSVTFNRAVATCASQSPDTVTVAGNTTTQITVVQKYYDTGLDDCYATHHNIEYRDAANAANMFRIIQYNNSDQYACLDIKFYAFFWINQAICPEATGSVYGPTNGQQTQVFCPPNITDCPPSEDGEPAQLFGFVIADAPPFQVTLTNNSSNTLACTLVDLNNKTDRNQCVINEPTVDTGNSAISLASNCGNKTYRLVDRTNVELLCYIDGTNSNGQQYWVPVTNGTTYNYTGSSARPLLLNGKRPKAKVPKKR